MNKFKVGDRVECINERLEELKHCTVKTGTVASLKGNELDGTIVVHFDEKPLYGHNGGEDIDTIYDDTHCLFIFIEDLRLLNEDNNHYSSSEIQPIEFIQSIFKDNKT